MYIYSSTLVLLIYKWDNIPYRCSGQFFPGLEMGRIGLSDELFLPKDIEWEGTFQMKQKTLINKKENPCSKV